MKRIIILLTLPLLLTGCAVIQINKSSTQSAKQASTGFYRTSNRGETWDFKSSIYTVGGQPRSFSGTNVTAMTMDPTDAKTIYLGSQQNGILYTTNSGDGWQGTLTDQGVVNGIAVDPQNHCIIYAAAYNKVFKTIDCSREWKMIHLSSLSGEFFTAIAVDNQDPRNIFLGTSRGTLLMSKDSGFSWESINFFSSQVSWLSANPNGSKKVFLATISSGIFSSPDSGRTWEFLSGQEVLDSAQKAGGPNRALKDLSGANNFLSMAYDPTDRGSLLYSNNYGMFRLTNEGKWREVKILNKPNQEKITALTLNPANGQELFFITDGAFYQTKNGGADWTVRKIPTPGVPKFLMINPTNSNELYVAYFKLK